MKVGCWPKDFGAQGEVSVSRDEAQPTQLPEATKPL